MKTRTNKNNKAVVVANNNEAVAILEVAILEVPTAEVIAEAIAIDEQAEVAEAIAIEVVYPELEALQAFWLANYKAPKAPKAKLDKNAEPKALTPTQATLLAEITRIHETNVSPILPKPTAQDIADNLGLSIFALGGALATLVERHLITVSKIAGQKKKAIFLVR